MESVSGTIGTATRGGIVKQMEENDRWKIKNQARDKREMKHEKMRENERKLTVRTEKLNRN
jgi:hypothetical protein